MTPEQAEAVRSLVKAFPTGFFLCAFGTPDRRAVEVQWSGLASDLLGLVQVGQKDLETKFFTARYLGGLARATELPKGPGLPMDGRG